MTPPVPAALATDRLAAAAERSWRLIVLVMVFTPVMAAAAQPRFWEAPHPLDLLGGASDATKESFGSDVYAIGQIIVAIAGTGLALYWRLRSQATALSRLLLAALFGLCASYALGAAFGTRPTFAPGLVSWPALLIGLSLIPPVRMERFLAILRGNLRLFMILTALAAAAVPAWSFEPEYAPSYIPGFPFRLHGLMAHANGLGPVVVFAILVELYACRDRWLWPAIGLAAFLLLLAQSKTSIAAAGLAIPLALATCPQSPFRRQIAPTVHLMAFGWVLAVVLLMSTTVFAGNLAEVRANSQFETLTGRSGIWSATLDEWSNNIWFGYGPRLWDDEMRAHYFTSSAGFAANHSHNQIIESLGHSGLVGLIAWLFLVGALIRIGFASAGGHGRLLLPWVVVLLVDTFSEPWFNRTAILSVPGLFYVVAVAAVMAKLPALPPAPPHTAPPAPATASPDRSGR